MLGKLYSIMTAFAVCMCVCGCEFLKNIHDGVQDESDKFDSAVVAKWWDGPRIVPGVALIVQVGTISAPPVMMEVQVDQKGEITLQHLLTAPVACNGLTLEALRQKLIKAYSVYYRHPQISVTFAPYDGRGVSPWGTVTVLGEVANPGPVNMPSTMDLTVTKVIQAAGGLKPFADRTKIKVTRCDKDGKQTKIYVDLNEIGKEGRIDKDMVLRPGDVVYVYETWY
jgi:protein involved in polysaccharide export with SLBB domain